MDKWKEEVRKELREVELNKERAGYIIEKIKETEKDLYKHDRPTSHIRPKEMVR